MMKRKKIKPGTDGSKQSSRMRHVYSVCTMLTSLFLLLSSPCLCAFELVLKPAVEIQKETIQLKDILIDYDLPTDMREQMIHEILSITIAHAPRPGKTRQISRAHVAMRLKNNAIDISTLAFDGASVVEVARGAHTITKEILAEYVKDYLIATTDIDREKTFVTVENVRDGLVIPQGTYAISHDPERISFRSGYINMRVIVSVAGEEYLRKLVNARVYEKKKVVVAGEHIYPRQSIEAGMLRLVEMRIDHGAEFFSAIEDVCGTVATMMIPAGDPVATAAIAHRPCIRKGDIVAARFNHKNMQISFKLQALEDGVKGETLRLYSRESNKHMTGRALGAGSVEVEL
jgi:flagella basal body P-ring formation protein FlgA